MSEKVCTSCKVPKDIADFYKNNRNKDRLFNHCKQCHKLKHKKWLASEKGKNYTRRRNKERYETVKNDQEFIEKRRAKDRKYYEANRDKKIASVRKYQAKEAAKKEISTFMERNSSKALPMLNIINTLVDLLDSDIHEKDIDKLLSEFIALKSKSINENQKN